MDEFGQGHGPDDVLKFVVRSFRFFNDGMNVFSVIDGKDPAKGIGAKVLDEGFEKAVTVLDEQVLELAGIAECSSVRHLTAWVDRRVGPRALFYALVGAPLADGIKLVEGQAEGVDVFVTGSAVRVMGVSFQLLSNGRLGAVRRVRFDRVDVGGRWRRGFAEDGLADPDSTVHGAMSRAIGSKPKDRPRGEKSATVVFGAEGNPLKASLVRFGESIEVAQARVGHRPVGLKKRVDG